MSSTTRKKSTTKNVPGATFNTVEGEKKDTANEGSDLVSCLF